MGVTELALLRLLNPDDLKDPSFLQILHNARLASEPFGASNAYYLRSPDDRSLFWIVSGWPSVQVHAEKWIGSAENQEVMAKLAGKIEVVFMYHVDVESELVKGVMGSQVVRIARYAVKKEVSEVIGIDGFGRKGFELTYGKEARERFQKLFQAAREEVKKGAEVGGWRIDRGTVKEGEDLGDGVEEVDEWVVFTGLEERDGRLPANAETWKECKGIVGYTGREDVKYGMVLNI
jgi:hypothetical protein